MTAPDSQLPQFRQSPGCGCAFLILGLLILIPSGLCTGTFGYLTIVEIVQGKSVADALSDGSALLGISGTFLAGAIFLIWLGWQARKR